MKEFILTYWKYLLEGLIALFILLVSIFRKPGKSNPALESLLLQLPTIIKKVEDSYGAGHGDVKKAAVLDAADDLFYQLCGVHIKNSVYYSKVVSNQIEKILSTPSRKEKNE